MVWKLDEIGNILYECPYCGSYNTSLASRMVVNSGNNYTSENSSMAYFNNYSIHEYMCRDCSERFYIDEDQRECIDYHIHDGINEE